VEKVTPYMNKKKIMVVDDDAGIVQALRLILEDEGYAVTAIMDGQTVRDMEGDVPDLLLLDIWMSGVDGRDICRHLKSRDRTRNMPIIICSANRDTQNIAKEAGADEFLTKPFDIDDLLGKVAAFIGTPSS
jgi:CheY-like chemotaxis protein